MWIRHKGAISKTTQRGMTKLEQELSGAMQKYTGSKDYAEILGKEAAKIAQAWITKAFDAGHEITKQNTLVFGTDDWFVNDIDVDKEQWLKNEGITPTI